MVERGKITIKRVVSRDTAPPGRSSVQEIEKSIYVDSLTEVYDASVSGDLVEVGPGTYDIGDNHIQLKDGVNWQFAAGVTITGTNTTAVFNDDGQDIHLQWAGNPTIRNTNGDDIVLTGNSTVVKDSYDSFPYSMLSIDFAGNKRFNFFVSTEGSDTNEGKTLDTAFLTIQKALSMIPVDVKGYHTAIYIAPGDYIINEEVPRVSSNGGITLADLSDEVNTGTEAYSVWVRNGKTTNLSSDPVRIIMAEGVSPGHGLFTFNGIHLTLTSGNLDVPGWNDSGRWFAGHLQFIGNTTRGSGTLIAIEVGGMTLEGQPYFEPKSIICGIMFMYCNDSYTNTFMGFRFIGGAGIGSGSNRTHAPIVFHSGTTIINFSSWGDGGFPAEVNNTYELTSWVDGHLFGCHLDGAVIQGNHAFNTKLYIDNGTARVDLRNSYQGVLAYKNDMITSITDESTLPHTIKEYNSGGSLIETRTYVNKDLYTDGTDLLFKGATVQVI